MNFRISNIWAFVSVGPDGDEGVIAMHTAAGGAMPLVAADEDRVNSLRPIAKELANKSGLTVRLKKFSTCVVIETYGPQGVN